MAVHVFDVTAFQAQFPEFASTSPATLNGYWAMATQYITSADGCLFAGDALQLALYLMTAHIAKLMTDVSAGNTPGGPATGASEGSVSISMAPPPFRNGWQFWLSTTPYGQQLWALLSVRSAGGFYIGGSFERASFRKAGGVF